MAVCVTTGTTAEGEVVVDLTEGARGLLREDRHVWLPDRNTVLRRVGIRVHTPFRRASSPAARVFRRRVLTRVRSYSATVFLPCVSRIGLRQMWARDWWSLRHRLRRGILMHTWCILFRPCEGHVPLHRAAFVAA